MKEEDNRYEYDRFIIDGMNWYLKMAEWDGFEEWIDEQIKVSKKISRREWVTSITCAIVGVRIGLIVIISIKKMCQNTQLIIMSGLNKSFI